LGDFNGNVQVIIISYPSTDAPISLKNPKIKCPSENAEEEEVSGQKFAKIMALPLH
jgi:hypothetical protein